MLYHLLRGLLIIGWLTLAAWSTTWDISGEGVTLILLWAATLAGSLLLFVRSPLLAAWTLVWMVGATVFLMLSWGALWSLEFTICFLLMYFVVGSLPFALLQRLDRGAWGAAREGARRAWVFFNR